MLNEFANVFSVELTNVMKDITSTMEAIIPDFAGDIFGNLLTLISPVWNPIWAVISDLLSTMFGF